MLGFGILGAAASTFVDEKRRQQVELKVLGSIMVKGLSATVVIFLAVKGGLAIFTTTNSTEPNPYVLFFFCLVGAVCSDEVWIFARDLFDRTFTFTLSCFYSSVSPTAKRFLELPWLQYLNRYALKSFCP